jgi:subtilisin family serine protease
MRAHRNALLVITACAALTLAGGAMAQNRHYSQSPSMDRPPPSRGGDGGFHGGNVGYRGGDGGFRDWRGRGRGWRGPGIVVTVPQAGPGGPYVEDDTVAEPARHTRHRQRSARRRGPSGAPPSSEHRYVPDEVVIEVANSVSARQINALQRRFRLTRVESHAFQLTGTTMFRWRIPDRRSVTTVVRALERDATVVSAQPNYLFALQQTNGEAVQEGDAAQYELAKLRLPQAHKLAKGDNVRVALIDSAVDLQSPELADSIVGTFDTLSTPPKPDKHGTAIAGLIAAHGKLMGAAPDAKLLAVRAFDPNGKGTQGTTFNILKGLDWAAANHARVINMSFAGPFDPDMHRALEAAHKKRIVLIAAAGNAGAKSPPLYPAADANVIAVSATDANDKLFAPSNRGRYITVAAPGDQILVAIPDGYEVSSGTSYSAAEVSGVAALLLQREPTLSPDRLRHLLQATAKDLGPKGRDSEFGAGLVDAYAALRAEPAPVAGAARALVPVRAGAR